MDNSLEAEVEFERGQLLDKLGRVETAGIICAVCLLFGPFLLVMGGLVLTLGLGTIINWRLSALLVVTVALALLVLALGVFVLLIGIKGRAEMRARRRRLRRQLARLEVLAGPASLDFWNRAVP